MLVTLKPWQKMLALVLVILAYVLTAKLGFFLALPPGNVTALWPPSGIAVAALLLLGYPMLAGVWVGSFIVNSWSLSGNTGMLVAAAIATGSSLQALAAALLLRGFLAPKSAPDEQNLLPDSALTVLRFVGFCGLAAVLAPTVGVASLCAAGFVPQGNRI